jgi:PRC-barrel domain
MDKRKFVTLSISAFLVIPAAYAYRLGLADHPFVLAQRAVALAQDDSNDDSANDDNAKDDDSPEARMNRRFPQKTTVGHLIGLPVLDDNDVTLGLVQKVVRTPEGKIKLIVSYSKWFGWFGRPVAVPIEVVAILGRQIDSLDMKPADYAKAPTWLQGQDKTIPDDEIIHIAIQRR